MNQKEKRLKDFLKKQMKNPLFLEFFPEIFFIEPGMGATDGLPDIFLPFWNGGFCFVELKKDKDTYLKPNQIRICSILRVCKIPVFRVFWADEVEEHITITEKLSKQDLHTFTLSLPKKLFPRQMKLFLESLEIL